MKYLIDTNICIYIMNKRPVDVIKKFKRIKNLAVENWTK